MEFWSMATAANEQARAVSAGRVVCDGRVVPRRLVEWSDKGSSKLVSAGSVGRVESIVPVKRTKTP